ncbi:hypothetical protein C1645_748715 [Glomus cerebriforme]|uniref:Uncharacterized protein n=1 Tax=Glomus cerebriforme TaxID=658196 RepID=A0A397TV67_9GLOM|nr:hypothetical protein C1645_748715 [Glomus cerebriforme]
MIQSATSLRNSRSQNINLETDPFYYYQKNNTASSDKRKFEHDSVEDTNINDLNIKRRKLSENEINDYLTKEIELDINMNFNQPYKNEYITKEIDLDINKI